MVEVKTLDKPQQDLLFQIEIVCWKCIHAVEYCEGITGKGESEFWKFTQNCHGEIACLLWCHIFNNYDQDQVHYKNLFGFGKLKHLGLKFQCENVQQTLLNDIKLDMNQYKTFRESVIKVRNKYVAHRDYEADFVIFPRINLLEDMCLKMRTILSDCVSSAAKLDPSNIDVSALTDYFETHTNDQLLKKCRKDIEQLQFF